MYGGEMLSQRANSSRQTLMPRLDGFMKWRILPLIGARNTYFALTARITPNMIGQNWLLAYSSMLTARAVMCEGSRNSSQPRGLWPGYSGRRSWAQPLIGSKVTSVVYAVMPANRANSQGCWKPSRV